MKKKKITLEGRIDQLPKYKIYLIVNHLEDGNYVLKITYKNKVIKETTFIKK